MGELLSFYRQSFQLAPEHEHDALRALVASQTREPFADAALSSAATLEAGLRVLGLGVRRDGRGYIVGISCVSDVPGSVEGRVFPALAPFVDEESFVDLIGRRDEGLVRYRFDGKGYARKLVRIIGRAWEKYQETLKAELAVSAHQEKKAAPTWGELSAPEAMPTYDSTLRFPAGGWLRHSKFGPGIVLAAEDGKVRVLFEGGERTLAAKR
jgi:hypothetical protein